MKTGKEIKFNKHKNFNVVFGSVNNKHSKAAYINISSWAEPIQENNVSYSRVIKDLNKRIKQTLFNYFDIEVDSNILKDRTIVDLDIRESGIKFGKRSFINCEITLFLNQEDPVNSEIMIEKLEETLELILENVFKTSKVFKFHKKKN